MKDVLRFDLMLNGTGLTFDRDYGCEHRSGWTVTVGGSHVVQLEPWLLAAFCKAVRWWWRTREDRR